MNCPQCQRAVQVGASFCDYCGNSLAGSAPTVAAQAPTGHGSAPSFAPTVMALSSSPKASGAIHCPQCGAKAIAGQGFCEECGNELATPIGQGGAQVPFKPPQPPKQADQSYQKPATSAHQPSPPPQRPLPPPQKPAYQPPPPGPPVQIPPTVVYRPPAQEPVAPIPPTVGPPSSPPTLGGMRGGAPPAKQPKLIVAGSGTVLDFGGKTEVLIGREDPIAGIFPLIDMTAHGGKEDGVSRQHAQILQQGNQWVIEDLNSVNHTYVNKKRVTPGSPHPLNKGDEIRVGRAILRFELF